MELIDPNKLYDEIDKAALDAYNSYCCSKQNEKVTWQSVHDSFVNLVREGKYAEAKALDDLYSEANNAFQELGSIMTGGWEYSDDEDLMLTMIDLGTAVGERVLEYEAAYEGWCEEDDEESFAEHQNDEEEWLESITEGEDEETNG